MLFYKITVKADCERFMEPTLHDTSEHFIIAYSSDQASLHVTENLRRGGWKITQMDIKEDYIYDIRDHSDQVTY
jgi:hypothetical protein